MDKYELEKLLLHNHTAFIQLIAAMDEHLFCKKVGDKWTPGQQAAHIIKSVSPVNMALKLPLFILKIIFGKANRPSKTFEQLFEKYKTKLAAGGRATGRFVPPPIAFGEQQKIIKTLEKNTATLCNLMLKLNEQQLDTFILPHPLLGKLTLREMLYFTAFHVEHHRQSVVEIVEK